MTQNYAIGLHNCAITKQFDRAVTVLLGQINTDDQGPIEVWSHLSAPGLQSLREDLVNPTGREHEGIVELGECCITNQWATCIRALIAVLPEIRNGLPTGREALIHAVLSLEGIDHLLKSFDQEPVLLDLAALAENTKQTPYYWTVVHRDSVIVSQLIYGEPERSFCDVRLPEVELLIVEPRDAFANLPDYRLHEGGFEKRRAVLYEALPLPVPDEPFAFVYYRRVTVTVLCSGGTGSPMSPRIVQVLGWRIERPAGDLICELGVEEDGSWAIYRRGRLLDGKYVSLLEDEFLEAMAGGRDR